MRKEMFDEELDNVTGGTVVVTDQGFIGFSTLHEGYALKGITWKDAREKAEDLLDANPNLSDNEFDKLTKQYFVDNNWI